MPFKKKRFFAAAAALGAFATLTGANAQPAFIGLASQRDNTAITKVDYYYPGHYGYSDGFYHGDGLFEIPGKVIGGVADLLSGALSGTYYRSSYYSRPLYVSPYYGSPYQGGEYYGSSYYSSPYDGRAYYFGPHYGGRRYYDDRGYYGHRRHYGGLGYGNDREYYGDRRHSSDRGYDGNHGYYDHAPYIDEYHGDHYSRDTYNGSRAYRDAYDDDD